MDTIIVFCGVYTLTHQQGAVLPLLQSWLIAVHYEAIIGFISVLGGVIS